MVFIPLSDDNPLRSIRYQWVTALLVAANVIFFLLENIEPGARHYLSFALVPTEFLKAKRRGVDRFLPERTKALPLERSSGPANRPAGEERLELVVDRAGEEHAPQHLATLLSRKARADLLATNEPVDRVSCLGLELPQPLAERDARHDL